MPAIMLVDTEINTTALASLAPQPIVNFPEGARVELYSLSGDRSLCRRLESMGLIPGKHVQILKNKGQGLVLKTEHTRLALRVSPAFCLEAVLAS